MLGIISLTLTIVVAILGFIANRARKARMRRALGRDVKESEMNSIGTWMKVVENEDQKPRQ